MNKRRFLGLLWLLPVAVLVLYLLDRYVWISAEEEIGRFIEKGRRAAESLSVLRCERLLAPDLATGSGMGRGEFLYFARVHFARLDELRVKVRDIEIDLGEDKTKAEVNLLVLLAGRDRDGTEWRGIRDSGSRFEWVFFRVEKRDGDWKAVFIDWEGSDQFRLK